MLISRAGICSRSAGRSGFTLLEIALVVFIISLFAAVVLPSFSGTGTAGLKSEAKKVASLLRYMNDSAIYSKRTYSITFDFHDRALSWNDPEGSRSGELGRIRSVLIPSKGEVREGQLTVNFGPLGLQESIEVTLEDEADEMKVAMNPLSGRVRITEAGKP